MSRAWLEALPRSLRTPGQSTTWSHVLQKWSISQPSKGASRQVVRSFHARPFQFRTRQAFFTPQSPLRQTQQRGFRFSPWRRNAGNGQTAEKPLSLSERFKKLTREYGRAAVAVYLILSVLDMPFFFLLVKSVGTERIGQIEHQVVSVIKTVIPESVRTKASEAWNAVYGLFKSKKTDEAAAQATEGWGVEEAQERLSQEASLGTQLALAYAIHKSFFFVRIPLTIAVTPRIVKQLRAWGWNIGKKLVKRP